MHNSYWFEPYESVKRYNKRMYDLDWITEWMTFTVYINQWTQKPFGDLESYFEYYIYIPSCNLRYTNVYFCPVRNNNHSNMIEWKGIKSNYAGNIGLNYTFTFYVSMHLSKMQECCSYWSSLLILNVSILYIVNESKT